MYVHTDTATAKGGSRGGLANGSPAAAAKPQGTFKNTSLSIDPARSGVPVSLELLFTPSMSVGAGECVTFTLPGFTGTHSDLSLATPHDASLAARLSVRWDAATFKLSISVGNEQEALPKDGSVAIVIASGFSSPDKGLGPHGMTLSCDAKDGVVAACAVECVPVVKGCSLSSAVHRGVLRLGRLLLQGGPRAMPDYNCVAYKCFLDVFRDADGVYGKHSTLMLAALCAEVALRAQPFAVDTSHGAITTCSFKQLVTTVEEAGRPFVDSCVDTAAAGGRSNGGGTTASAAAVASTAAGGASGSLGQGGAAATIEALEGKVKRWIKEIVGAIKVWEALDKKECDADASNERALWNAGLESVERVVVLERLLAMDLHADARKELGF